MNTNLSRLNGDNINLSNLFICLLFEANIQSISKQTNLLTIFVKKKEATEVAPYVLTNKLKMCYENIYANIKLFFIYANTFVIFLD